MATFPDLTTSQLRQAIEIREQIAEPQAKLNALLGGTAPKAKSSDHVAGHTKSATAVVTLTQLRHGGLRTCDHRSMR